MSAVKKTAGSAAGLHRRAVALERSIAGRAPPGYADPPPETAAKLLHELRVRQIELELQNEELRRVQLELDAARARYFDLYDLAPLGYCTLSEDGGILEANVTFGSLVGVARAELLRQPITRFIDPEDQDVYYLHRKRLFGTGEPQSCELRLRAGDGRVFWARLDAAVAPAAGGGLSCRVIASDVSADRAASAKVAELLREKEILLKETHHRIKNNLTSVYSFLRIQAMGHEASPAAGILADAAGRVQSMMLLYEKLYRANDFRGLGLKTYLPQLVAEIIGVFPPEPVVLTDLEFDDIELNVRALVPLGIILNELITNSMKYAFVGRRGGRIGVTVAKDGDRIAFRYRDDGVGLPDSLALPQPGRSGAGPDALAGSEAGGFGLHLIALLVQQIGGTLEAEAGKGARFLIRFPA